MKKQLHVISTGKQTEAELVNIIEKIHHVIDVIHLREKTWSANKLVQVIELLHSKGVPLTKIFVNDRIDVVLIMKTAGVQLAHHSIDVAIVRNTFPELKIGCSVHSIDEAILAEREKADHVFYGHIFKTSSKPGIPPKGLNELQRMKSLINIPIIAIGGITPENTLEVMKQGVDGIAVMSGILLQDDPLEAVRKYRISLEKEIPNE